MAKKNRTPQGKVQDLVDRLNLRTIVQEIEYNIENKGKLTILPVDITHSHSIRVQNNIRTLNSKDLEFLRMQYDPNAISIFLNNNHSHGLIAQINSYQTRDEIELLLKCLNRQYDTEVSLELETNPVTENRINYLKMLQGVTGTSKPSLVNMLSQPITQTGFYNVEESGDLSIDLILGLEEFPQIGQKMRVFTYSPKIRNKLFEEIKRLNSKEYLEKIVGRYAFAS